MALKEIAVSTGSACTSATRPGSRTVMARARGTSACRRTMIFRPDRTIRAAVDGTPSLMIGNPGAVAYDTKREEILAPN